MTNAPETITNDEPVSMGFALGDSPSLHRPLIAIHVVSLLLVIWMYAGGLVSYAPTLSNSEIQNIYLGRMLWYGIPVAMLQLIGILLSVQSKSVIASLLPEQYPQYKSKTNS